jgi:hypothetical protein
MNTRTEKCRVGRPSTGITAEEKKFKDRERVKKYYESHREEILAKRRAHWRKRHPCPIYIYTTDEQPIVVSRWSGLLS